MAAHTRRSDSDSAILQQAKPIFGFSAIHESHRICPEIPQEILSQSQKLYLHRRLIFLRDFSPFFAGTHIVPKEKPTLEVLYDRFR